MSAGNNHIIYKGMVCCFVCIFMLFYASMVYYLVDTGMVSALDEAVGNVTEALKQRGFLDNALIVFTTDVSKIQC